MLECLGSSWTLIVLPAGIIAVLLLLPRRATPVSTLTEVIGNGRPTLVEISGDT